MYHRILPADDTRTQYEEPGMVVTPETFALHLRILREYFNIIHLTEWIEKKQKGEVLPAKSCAVTFDDGWRDNFEYAFPVLWKTQTPATIFLVADMIGSTDTFWPQRLTRLIQHVNKHPEQRSHPVFDWLPDKLTTSSLSSEQISVLINKVKQYSDVEIHQYIDNCNKTLGIDDAGTDADLLDWQQVTAMQASGLVDIGSHTCQHTRLTSQLSSEQLEHEIVDSKAIIEQHIGKPVNLFCYPNGDLCDLAVQKVAQHYDGAVTTQSGWNNASSDVHQLKRMGVHEDIASDKTAFLARISGWL